MADTDAPMPRWVKISLILAAIVVALFLVVLVLGGEHGPGRHMPAHSLGGLSW